MTATPGALERELLARSVAAPDDDAPRFGDTNVIGHGRRSDIR